MELYHGRTSAARNLARAASGVLRSSAMKRLACLVLAAIGLAASVAHAGEDPGGRTPSDEALRHYLNGRWLEEEGDLAGAGAEFARAAALDPTATDILVHAAEVAAHAGDPARSLELARQALVRVPGEPRALWLQGAALFGLSRPAEALQPLRQAALADSENADVWRTLAHTGEALELPALVDSCWERVTDLDPDDGESWFQLATTRARLGRYADADSALTIALEDNPTRPGALFLRGWLAEQLGRTADAISLYTHHLEVHGGDGTTRRRLVALLASEDRYKEALPHARRVAADSPRDPGALQALADLEFYAGHADAGMRELERLRALEPGDMDPVVRSAEVLLRHERADAAVTLVDQWAATRAGDPHAYRVRAWVRAAAGRLDSAVAMQRLDVAANPDSTVPRRALARYLRESKQWNAAIEQLSWLHTRLPEDPGVLMDLGYCREQSGDLPGAIQAGRDALALAPDEAQTLNFLGYLLADHDRDLSEAEDLIRRAIEQDPDNGAYLDSMGWVHFRRGNLDAARSELEKAVDRVGNDPVVHEHLGDVYRQLRLIDLARQQYRASLDADRGNERVRNKLTELR